MVLTTTLLTNTTSDIKDYLETVFTHGAIGTDNTAATAADTALGAEVFRDAIDNFDKTSQATKVFALLKVLTTEANGNAIAEQGWLDAAAAGNLQQRSVVNTINKTSDIQLFLETAIGINVVNG